MAYKIASLILAAALCGAFAPAPDDQRAREIVQSMRLGRQAEGVMPPYGLPLYPGAKVNVAMMGGMALGITVDAGADKLGNFYAAALTERGYVIDQDETKDGRRTIDATERTDRTSKMAVSISPNARDSSKFTLTFVKLKTP